MDHQSTSSQVSNLLCGNAAKKKKKAGTSAQNKGPRKGQYLSRSDGFEAKTLNSQQIRPKRDNWNYFQSRGELQTRIIEFIKGNQYQCQLEPMPKNVRYYIHELANRYKLNTRSQGKDSTNSRFVVLFNPACGTSNPHPSLFGRHNPSRPNLMQIAGASSKRTGFQLSEKERTLTRKIFERFPLSEEEKRYLQPQNVAATTKKSGLKCEDAKLSRRPPLVPGKGRTPREIQKQRSKLPVAEYRSVILDAIRDNQVLLITGETGCGKTTQVGQFIMEECHEQNRPCRIIVTQPRRLPAVTVADRVASELGESVGETIGRHVRLDKKQGKKTILTFCTAGVLLRSLTDSGELMETCTHIVLDEIHERDSTTDFILTILKQKLNRYPGLKLILMSATMERDREHFKDFFDGAEDIFVGAQVFPVEEFFLDSVLRKCGYETDEINEEIGGNGDSNGLDTSVDRNGTAIWHRNLYGSAPQSSSTATPVEGPSTNLGLSGYAGNGASAVEPGQVPQGFPDPSGLLTSGSIPVMGLTTGYQNSAASAVGTVTGSTPAMGLTGYGSSAVTAVNELRGIEDSGSLLVFCGRSQLAKEFFPEEDSVWNKKVETLGIDHWRNPVNGGIAPVNGLESMNGRIEEEKCWDDYQEPTTSNCDEAGESQKSEQKTGCRLGSAGSSDDVAILPEDSEEENWDDLPRGQTDGGQYQWDMTEMRATEKLTEPMFTLGKEGEDSDKEEKSDEEDESDVDEKDGFLRKYFGRRDKDNPLLDSELLFTLLLRLIDEEREGAILVFLPGYEDIMSVKERFESNAFAYKVKALKKIPDIHVLHGQMSNWDDRSAFEPANRGHRKIILATNIAEASLTINDVTVVVDSGLSKEKSYDSERNIGMLKQGWISKANAAQRKGRAGRCQPGVCYRLYSRGKKSEMDLAPVPELKRIAIHQLCLQCKQVAPKGMSVADFLLRAPDPPDPKDIKNAVNLLKSMEAMTEDEELTELGRILCDMPVEPQLATLLLNGIFLRCFDAVLNIVAILSYRDPFTLPQDLEVRHRIEKERLELASGQFSDHFLLVRVMQEYESARAQYGYQPIRRVCSKYHLSKPAMEMISGIKDQLQTEMFKSGMLMWRDQALLNENSGNLTAIKAAVASACSLNVGYIVKDGKNSRVETEYDSYQMLFPGSVTRHQMRAFSAVSRPGEPPERTKNRMDYTLAPTNYLVFNERTQLDSGLYLKQISCVTAATVALFSGKGRLDQSVIEDALKLDWRAAEECWDDDSPMPKSLKENCLKLSDWLWLSLNHQDSELILQLRMKWKFITLQIMEHPRNPPTEAEGEVLRVILELLGAQELQSGLKNPFEMLWHNSQFKNQMHSAYGSQRQYSGQYSSRYGHETVYNATGNRGGRGSSRFGGNQRFGAATTNPATRFDAGYGGPYAQSNGYQPDYGSGAVPYGAPAQTNGWSSSRRAPLLGETPRNLSDSSGVKTVLEEKFVNNSSGVVKATEKTQVERKIQVWKGESQDVRNSPSPPSVSSTGFVEPNSVGNRDIIKPWNERFLPAERVFEAANQLPQLPLPPAKGDRMHEVVSGHSMRGKGGPAGRGRKAVFDCQRTDNLHGYGSISTMDIEFENLAGHGVPEGESQKSFLAKIACPAAFSDHQNSPAVSTQKDKRNFNYSEKREDPKKVGEDSRRNKQERTVQRNSASLSGSSARNSERGGKVGQGGGRQWWRSDKGSTNQGTQNEERRTERPKNHHQRGHDNFYARGSKKLSSSYYVNSGYGAGGNFKPA